MEKVEVNANDTREYERLYGRGDVEVDSVNRRGARKILGHTIKNWIDG